VRKIVGGRRPKRRTRNETIDDVPGQRRRTGTKKWQKVVRGRWLRVEIKELSQMLRCRSREELKALEVARFQQSTNEKKKKRKPQTEGGGDGESTGPRERTPNRNADRSARAKVKRIVGHRLPEQTNQKTKFENTSKGCKA